MKLTLTFRVFLLSLACSFGTAAVAQWQWIDKDGHKVFSDRAPPVEIPQKNILKQPSGSVSAQPSVAEAATAPDGTTPETSAPAGEGLKVSSTDKQLEEKKKQAEAAEAAKVKADQERVLKAKIENCARAKQAKATFDSGVRVARTNAAGERVVMDDAARAAETRRIQAIIDSDCR